TLNGNVPPVDGNATVGAQGGIQGNAPINKDQWNAQKTRDLSRNLLKAKDSTTTDFGQSPYTQYQQSGGSVNYTQDGPRSLTFNWTVPQTPTYSSPGKTPGEGMNYRGPSRNPVSGQTWQAPTATQNWYGEYQRFQAENTGNYNAGSAGQTQYAQRTIAPY